jgi:hypothetical protein
MHTPHVGQMVLVTLNNGHKEECFKGKVYLVGETTFSVDVDLPNQYGISIGYMLHLSLFDMQKRENGFGWFRAYLCNEGETYEDAIVRIVAARDAYKRLDTAMLTIKNYGYQTADFDMMHQLATFLEAKIKELGL